MLSRKEISCCDNHKEKIETEICNEVYKIEL